MRSVSLLPLLLIFTLLCPLLASCDKESGSGEASTEEYEFTDISGIEAPLTLNGQEVPYSLFRYYLGAVIYHFDQGDESYWETHDYSERMRNEALEYLQKYYAVISLAEEYGVELTEYELNEVESEFASVKYSYNTNYDFCEMLDSNYLDEDTYRDILKSDALYNKLFAYLTSEDSGNQIKASSSLALRFIENHVCRAEHILIVHSPGEDINENETLISEIYGKLKSGEDFAELRKKYSEDTDTADSDIGYYFTEGDIGLEFENIAFALEEGAHSGIVEAPYGWHIIRRLPIDYDYVEENMDSFISFYQSHIFEIMLENEAKEQDIVLSESFHTYTPQTIK